MNITSIVHEKNDFTIYVRISSSFEDQTVVSIHVASDQNVTSQHFFLRSSGHIYSLSLEPKYDLPALLNPVSGP